MFTYKFVGLDAADATTLYYYGSLPAKPELGHILVYDETGTAMPLSESTERAW